MTEDINQAAYNTVMTAYRQGVPIPEFKEVALEIAERYPDAPGQDFILAIQAAYVLLVEEMKEDAAKTQAFLDSEVGRTMRAIPGMTTGEAMRLHGYWKDKK